MQPAPVVAEVRPARVDQIVPSFAGRDAIGTHVLHTRDALRDAGFKSDVWAIDVLPEVRDQARPLAELGVQPQPGTWWIFHHSIGTPAAAVVAARTEPTLIDYHNITPAALLERWAPWVRDEVDLGRRQLAELAGVCFASLADSQFNADELIAAGYRNVTVVPPLFDLDAFRAEPDAGTAARLCSDRSAGGSDWLFVGRVAPHKAQHELVKALAVHRSIHDPAARLRLVGSAMGEDYPRALQRFARRLGVGDAVEVTGMVSAAALAAYYQLADVFVCASDHEGFCVPVVEAMHVGLPVVAHAAAAVPETAGGAGMLLQDRSPLAMAVAAHRAVSDARLRSAMIAAGRRRAQYFTLERGRRRMVAAVEQAAMQPAVAAGAP